MSDRPRKALPKGNASTRGGGLERLCAMMATMKHLLLTIAMIIGIAQPAWADAEAARTAFKSGDYETALSEFRQLVEEGNTRAKIALGAMHARGKGVPKDLVTAYMWFSLAASDGNKRAGKIIKRLAKRLSAEELSKANTLVQDWLAKQAKK